jgi:hypothetical protein
MQNNRYEVDVAVKCEVSGTEVKVEPAMCLDCMRKQAQTDYEKKLNFTNGHIFVKIEKKEVKSEWTTLGRKQKYKLRSQQVPGIKKKREKKKNFGVGY